MAGTQATRAELEKASKIVHSFFPGTNCYSWPLLSQRLGAETWVKHENHTPIGAFKIRGGLVYMNAIRSQISKVITATRGNHGQSIATAAGHFGMEAVIVVPEGNSREKNAAMKAQGAELIIHGQDFQESAEFAAQKAKTENLHMLPSYHELLVQGVGTYGMEFFQQAPDLDVVYVPIGMGSGICGMISARDALGLKTKIVGVVAEGAPSYAESFQQKQCILSDKAETIADGMACRSPAQDALDIIFAGAEDVVMVSDTHIKGAIHAYYKDTHNVTEGAAAAPLAAAMNAKEMLSGKKVGLVCSGGNIDASLFMSVMADAEQMLR